MRRELYAALQCLSNTEVNDSIYMEKFTFVLIVNWMLFKAVERSDKNTSLSNFLKHLYCICGTPL